MSDALTPAESARIAARQIRDAIRELDKPLNDHIAAHIRFYLDNALIWLRCFEDDDREASR